MNNRLSAIVFYAAVIFCAFPVGVTVPDPEISSFNSFTVISRAVILPEPESVTDNASSDRLNDETATLIAPAQSKPVKVGIVITAEHFVLCPDTQRLSGNGYIEILE